MREEWRLALQAPWSRFTIGLGVACVVAALLLSVWSSRGQGARLRLQLGGLRAAALLAALTLFLQPALQLDHVTRLPNQIAVLVDGSESMGLAERAGAATRAARAAAFVAGARERFAAWRGEHRLDFYSFGTSLTPSTEAALASTAPAPQPGTRLREALSALRSRYRPRELGGVVVISDGIDNGRLAAAAGVTGQLDAEARDFLASLEAPVHTVWTGRLGLADVAVSRVIADDFAFAKTVVKVEAVIRILGAEAAGWAGRTLPVTLRRDGALVRSVEIKVDPAKPEQKVAFEFSPDRLGKYLYEIAVPVQDGETIPGNNARPFLLKVIRDKIRVLQVAGRPSWDERFLRGLLKHDPNVDLISFFILRSQTDIEAVPPEEMSLIPFPTEELFLEQLRSFDVVFLQNFNYGPYGIGAYLDEIKRFVDEGGGLVMLGGDLSFASGGYGGTPVAEVLPVELPDALGEPTLVSLDPFRPLLTVEGRSHPVTALRFDGRDHLDAWATLPPLEGTNLVSRARPGATVLAGHPFLKGRDGKPMPILAVGEFGKGRSLALTADSSWRWGFGAAGDDDAGRGRIYQRFWEGAVRWLIRDPELRFLRVETDQAEYLQGEAVRITVRTLTPDYTAAKGVEVQLAIGRVASSRGGAQALTTRTLRSDEQGLASVDLEPPPPGGYRIAARARLGASGPSQDEEVFLVREGGPELADPEARSDLLRAVAEAGGGRFQTIDDPLPALPFRSPEVVRVSRHRDLELWSSWLSLVVAAVALGGEWWLRRRRGLA